jgi:mRNA-degrading endonuclease RelE of RelBE toxin-antitoxin system
VYKVEFSPQALKSIKRLPRNVAHAILAELEAIAADPNAKHAGVRPLRRELKGKYRLHWAGFRAIFELRRTDATLFVIDILSRGKAYD